MAREIELTYCKIVEILHLKVTSESANDREWNSKAALKILRKNHAGLCKYFRPSSTAASLCEQLFSSDLLSLPTYEDVIYSPRNINNAFFGCCKHIIKPLFNRH